MARKASADTGSPRGFNDIIGLTLLMFALLLLASLLSYDSRDIAANNFPATPSPRNWIGVFGANLAYHTFFWVGVGAYVLPVLMVFIGLGCFFQAFAYLRRRWLWGLVLFLCCIGLLDLYRAHLPNIEARLHTYPGGTLGIAINRDLFGYFGTMGATILFLMLYFISLLYLTNFQLGEWLRSFSWNRPRAEDEKRPQDQEAPTKRRSSAAPAT